MANPYCLNFIKIAIILSLKLLGKADEVMDPTEYSKLTLNLHELKGSRWALEQSRVIKVYYAFDIVDMNKVDVDGMKIRVEFYLRQRWETEGLELPPGLFKDSDSDDKFISAEENVLKSVWSPDSFIPNAQEIKIHSLNAQNSVVQIYKNRTIVFKARMYAVLGCSFTFEWYPLDIQICDMIFESYKYARDLVRYEFENFEEPVLLNKNIILYQYDIVEPLRLKSGFRKRWGGKWEYPYVKITFKFERKLGNNIIQVFTPTTLITILSFFSFWLGLDAVPGRISLLVTCILTIVTMHSGLKGSVPTVHYIKMMDIWMIGCMGFIFAAICEFIIVKYMKWRTQQIKNAKEEQEKIMENLGIQKPTPPPMNKHPAMNLPMQNMMPNAYPPEDYSQHPYLMQYLKNADEADGRIPPMQTMMQSEKRQAWQKGQFFPGAPPHFPGDFAPGFINMHEVAPYHRPVTIPSPTTPLWVQIDRVCRILFPLLFCIFNGAYWPILLLEAAKQHKNV